MMFPLILGAGLNTDDTAFAVHPAQTLGPARPGYVDMDKARFWNGEPQTIGGWENFLAGSALTGVCRGIQPWRDNASNLNVAWGTHSNLEVYLGGVLYDITPTLALPSLTLANNPITTHAGSPTVDVAQTGHPYLVSDSIVISGSPVVDTVTINGTWTVTAVTTNSWSFTAGSNGAAGVTGGGAAVVVTPQRAFAAGAIDGTGSAGYGTGTYSSGTYSQPSTADFFPRTWAFANYGQTLIANPRNGPIYQWNNATGTPAAPLANSPPQVNFALVTPQRQVVAFGCNQVTSGLYNPMTVRGCDIEAPTSWTPSSTNNAWEQRLEGGGRMVGARLAGDQIFAWSDLCLWQAQFIGDPGQTYRFTKLGSDCGLIGPNAAAMIDQQAYWLDPNGAFHTCVLGGEPSRIPCPVAADMWLNLAASQSDKIVAALVPAFGEVWWFYPDARDGNEVSRYVGYSHESGVWNHGTFDRTAFHAGGPAGYPLGASYGGTMYLHEKGQTADGGQLAYFWESGAQYVGNADQRVEIKAVWPDFKNQVGPVNLTLYTRGYPQDTLERTKGPFALAPGQSKRSLLADCRVARVRVAGNSSPAFCRGGKLQFDGVETGGQ
jgi:hypothetical protein